jgi:hypothetical protein
MSSPQNTGVVKKDEQSYFNNFFINERTVSSNQNDAIVGYFEQYTNGNKSAARTIASAVIYTSISQGMDPMQVLNDFVKLPKGQLNAYLAMFLNLNRVGTSLLGINNQPITNKYITRAILA